MASSMTTNSSAPYWLSSRNQTATALWNFNTVFSLGTASSTLLLNTATLLCFLKNPTLRKQPFNVYLICLLLNNIFSTCVVTPLQIIDHMFPVWWMGPHWCLVYIYMLSCVPNYQKFSHALITVSRVWAVTFPHSYRHRHTRNLAFILCGSMIVYVNMIYGVPLTRNVATLKVPWDIYFCGPQSMPDVYQVRKSSLEDFSGNHITNKGQMLST